ncbi:MAG: PQQ-dependent sugar dehydrogenase [Verrucomicrobia bacterium]|nr:PQQ-dependent sugar dehydrogenase [Verrucomicrobiota bacterium]
MRPAHWQIAHTWFVEVRQTIPLLPWVWGMLISCVLTQAADPFTIDTRLQLRLIMNTTDSSGAYSVRIAKDRRNNDLYYSKLNGNIYRVTILPGGGRSKSAQVYGAADHGLSENVQGMTIGPEGTIYLVGNITTSDGKSTFARIMKGVPNSSGGREWSLLAKTEAYPRSQTLFDHVFNGIVVSPDGSRIYVNSDSCTDHGEVQSANGAFPSTREVPLTAKIFRLPANGSDLLLRNDEDALRSAGYIVAEGTRNSFDLAFAANGDLFATENGPDRDMDEELNWIRQGLHYGFPWRIGGADNPQQFPNYDPSKDRLLDRRFLAVQSGYYHNDPAFPPPPANFAEPVKNVGPDADSFRDPKDGLAKDASRLGKTGNTFTAHRSPLGLVFDTTGAMSPPFQNHGFALSWTHGDPDDTRVPGPFFDASQDLLDLNLVKLGDTNYQARVTRIATNFANPIDAEIIGHRIYVLEYGAKQGIWEVTFPPARPAVTILHPAVRGTSFSFSFATQSGLVYEVQFNVSFESPNWTVLTNFTGDGSLRNITETIPATQRFYRVRIQ